MIRSFYTLFYIVLFTFFSLTISPAKAATPMGLMTGGLQGTYYQFGLNLKELMKNNGIDLTVLNSNGSVSNVYAVYKRPGTQMGIVQSDVLAFVAKVEKDPVLKKIAQKMRMVFPLYNEEIHLVGNKDVTSFDELQGKNVAIGKEGSGTYLTAKLLFKVSGIQPANMINIGTADALTKLKEGKVDAMFYVAGYPVKLFTEQISASDNLHVVPIENKAIVDFYPESEIPGSTYSWQTESVNSVAVKAVLVSYNFRNTQCKNVGRFRVLLKNNLEWLKKNGHPKWRSVDLDYPLKGWEQYDCVKKRLYTTPVEPPVEPPLKQEDNPILDAIKKML
ncbi:MAG: TRAP transporter TAXI family solute receptor [Desulforhopalus sp.]|jgi:TRAP transporter TAXI family solute receptor